MKYIIICNFFFFREIKKDPTLGLKNALRKFNRDLANQVKRSLIGTLCWI